MLELLPAPCWAGYVSLEADARIRANFGIANQPHALNLSGLSDYVKFCIFFYSARIWDLVVL